MAKFNIEVELDWLMMKNIPLTRKSKIRLFVVSRMNF